MAGSGDFDCFEAFVNGKSEYEGIARGKATLHLRQTLDQALIGYGGVFGCLRVASCRRSRPKLGYNVRPHRFGTGSLIRNRFDSIPDRRTAVGAGGTFKNAFVVVNEEARRDKDLRQALLHLVELDRTSDGVGGTAAELSLVIN